MRRTNMQNTTPKSLERIRSFDVKDVLDKLNLTADLLELTGASGERSEAFRSAHQQLRSIEFGDESPSLAHLEGHFVGLSTEAQRAIVAFVLHQSFELLESLQIGIPEKVLEMLSISGLGPKRLREVWKTMGIQSMAQLYHATTENRLLKAKGFGPKTQAKVRLGIEKHRKNGAAYFYHDLLPYSRTLHLALTKSLGNEAGFQLCGDMRAARTICDGIQYVVHSDFFNEVMVLLIRQENYELMTAGQDLLLARVRGTEIPIEFKFSSQNYYLDLFKHTGSAIHVQFVPVNLQHEYVSEQEIYAASGLNYLDPELREGREELMPNINRNIDADLLQQSQIKGLLHAHTKMSDGCDDLEAMAIACRDLGMDYLGITDHAPNAWHDLGISEANLETQRKAIDQLNQQLAPFKIYWGIEADIQADGGLGMTDEALQQFDFVIAGLHGNEKLSRAEATIRTIKAIRNPYTTILAHPNGQLLGSDEAFPVELDLIMEECLARNVAIELNCCPERMDLNWDQVRMASKLGLMVSVNPNAHDTAALSDYIHGVKIARKGLLPTHQCLNALSQANFEAWLRQRTANRI